MTNTVDAVFPVQGSSIPLDHGYVLYGAISGRVSSLHRPAGQGSAGEATEIGVFPIRGLASGDRLGLTPRSTLRLRVPAGRMAEVVRLAGASLDVGGQRMRVGVPSVRPLTPSPDLSAGLVVIKVADMAETKLTVARFTEAARRQLDALSIPGEIGLPVHLAGPHAGEPRRRVLRVKGAIRVGYALLVTGLTADESIRLQTAGLGGRRSMGCGLFLPAGGPR